VEECPLPVSGPIGLRCHVAASLRFVIGLNVPDENNHRISRAGFVPARLATLSFAGPWPVTRVRGGRSGLRILAPFD
jgi:hypothetical protein